MRTEDLIIQLAADARPVRALAPPSARLAWWAALAIVVSALGVVAIHARSDLATALQRPDYLTRAATTIATALLSAAIAFVLSVPGRERSRYQRALPFLAGGSWVLCLGVLLAQGGDSIARLTALPINPLCIYQIVALSAVPGIALFVMLRRAAPLQPGWNAWFGSLATLAAGAAATQLICPVDDASHQLVGHVAPVVVLTAIVAVAARTALDWPKWGLRL